MKTAPDFVPARLPADIDGLLDFSTACGCGRRHAATLRYAAVSSGAVVTVPEMVAHVGRQRTILVVADKNTADIAGRRVQQRLGNDGHAVGLLLLPDGADGRPHADEAGLGLVQRAMQGADLGVAVGSGTVNDLAKLASYRLGIPYISVATAPSMNGYTSAIAAILVRGVKRTIDCHQPLAVIADLDILRQAPAPLIAAGLGDLESKPTATADYRLGGLLRGDYYCPAPEQVVLGAEQRAAEKAAGLKTRDPASIRALTEALILSGMTMKLAGSSSPASGGEHLISHFWDMTAEADDRSEGWHGAQVGVATIVTAALYGALRQLDPGRIDPDRIVAQRAAVDAPLPDIRRIHGVHADDVIAEYRSKRLDDQALREEVAWVRDNWDVLWGHLSTVLRPPAAIRDILRAAGAPTTAAALGLTPAHIETAFRHARFIRGRFTVLDFADDLGVLDALTPEVLAAAGV